MQPDIEGLYAALNEQYFGNILPSDLEVSWSDRLNKVASYVTVNGIGMPVSIEINDAYFKSKKYNIDLLTEALAHAMTHLWRIDSDNSDRHDALFFDKLGEIISEPRLFGMLQNDVKRTDVKTEPHLVQVVCPSHGILYTRARMPKDISRSHYHRGAGTGMCPHPLKFVDMRVCIPEPKEYNRSSGSHSIKVF